MSKKRKWIKVIAIGILVIGVVGAGALFGIKGLINAEANRLANNAVEYFHKDRVESLIALVQSEDFDIDDKNNAVWVLGILKNERALPVLDSLLTGAPCDHAHEICQYEVKKAILKIKGEYRGSWQVSD